MICVCFSCVKWGEIRPTFFSVMYDVRQGSLLAFFLFAIYLDTLSGNLHAKFRSIYYPIGLSDNILLMTYSVVDLEKLIRLCESELN